MRRHVAALAALATEAFLYQRYAAFGAEFHYWLHGLFGVTLGLLVVSAGHLCGKRLPISGVWLAGVAAHLVSATPDALYLNVGVLHMRWMDVFAFHISVHFIDGPLVVALILFVTALLAWGAAVLQHPRVALSAGALAVVVMASALATRSPIPSNLIEVQEQSGGRLFCALPVSGRP